jgi:hypothetical protein
VLNVPLLEDGDEGSVVGKEAQDGDLDCDPRDTSVGWDFRSICDVWRGCSLGGC